MNETETLTQARLHVADQFMAVRDRLAVYALSLTRDREQAADLMQDICVRVLENATSYQQGTNFPAWAFRLMRNHFLDGARRKKNQPHEDVAVVVVPVFPRQEDGIRTRTLTKYLMLLPAQTRRILLMAGLEEMDYEQIAEKIGVSVGTVKSKISRARDLLDGAL